MWLQQHFIVCGRIGKAAGGRKYFLPQALNFYLWIFRLKS